MSNIEFEQLEYLIKNDSYFSTENSENDSKTLNLHLALIQNDDDDSKSKRANRLTSTNYFGDIEKKGGILANKPKYERELSKFC